MPWSESLHSLTKCALLLDGLTAQPQSWKKRVEDFWKITNYCLRWIYIFAYQSLSSLRHKLVRCSLGAGGETRILLSWMVPLFSRFLSKIAWPHFQLSLAFILLTKMATNHILFALLQIAPPPPSFLVQYLVYNAVLDWSRTWAVCCFKKYTVAYAIPSYAHSGWSELRLVAYFFCSLHILTSSVYYLLEYRRTKKGIY